MRNKINWVKSAIFILLMFLIIIGNVYIYLRFFMEGSLRLKDNIPTHIQQTIDSAVDRTSNMAAVQIIKVDLRKNIRYIAYSSIKDPVIKKLYSNFVIDNITAEVPVFTKNSVQNSRMLSIINHEFTCYPFTDTVSYEMVPEMAKYIKTVCATTIPVQSGKFEGFVAVFLTKEPTDTEKDLIRIESIVISQEAYEVIK